MDKNIMLHCEQWTHPAQAGFGLAAVKSVMYLQCILKLHKIQSISWRANDYQLLKQNLSHGVILISHHNDVN